MRTWIEIDAAAVRYNLRTLRKLLGNTIALWPVIKANAYGHGFLEIAKICTEAKEVNGLCVVDDEEAIVLVRNHLDKLPIIILSFYELDHKKIATLITNGVILPLFTINQAIFIEKIAKKIGKRARVHIKIDTGASRIGVPAKEVIDFTVAIKKMKHLDIVGAFSHFASSETSRTQTLKQLQIFRQTIKKVRQQGIGLQTCHMACSAAAILYPEARLDAVRIGLSLYGLYPEKNMFHRLNLQPALSLKTKIVQVKKIATGTKIGYGGTFITKKQTTLAIIPIGYWDGYDRKLSNQAAVLIHGKRCPIRGRICMNMTMVDVSGVPKVKVGDIVTVIGQQGGEKITIDELAQQAQTINYEIADRLNPFLPRLVK